MRGRLRFFRVLLFTALPFFKLANPGQAQELTSDNRVWYHRMDYVWRLDSAGLSWDEVSQWDVKHDFKKGHSEKIRKSPEYWVKILWPKDLIPQEEEYYFYYYRLDEFTLYHPSGDSLKAGIREPSLGENRPKNCNCIRLDSSYLFPDHTLLAKVRYADYYSKSQFYFSLVGPETFAHYLSTISIDQYWDMELNTLLFTGATIMLLAYFMGIYIFNKQDSLYLYYMAYLLTIGMYMFDRSIASQLYLFIDLKASYPNFIDHFHYSIQFFVHLMYLLFAMKFLNARQEYPLFYKTGIWIGGLVALTAIYVIVSIEFFPDSIAWHVVFTWERIILIIYTFLVQFYVYFTMKNRLALFIIFGSLFFITGALMAVLLYHVRYMMYGTLLEIFAFALGLGYKIRMSELQKLDYQEKLIGQLQENDRLQKRYNEELKEEVKARSEEVVAQKMAVEEEKKRTLEISLKREIDKVKMIALRTQMKPHFLFNALNSIRALILHQKNEDAYDSLSKFSKLIRYILESSEYDTVTISEEIKMLKLYVNLEQMRFNDQLDFTFEIGSQIEKDQDLIPPLILQPFIENAILHGLSLKEGNKKLLVRIEKEKNHLSCIVRDNGVGREHAAQVKAPSQKKSMAIDLTHKRIQLLSKNRLLKEVQADPDIEILDLKSQVGESQGTEVRIRLPLIQKP